MNQILVYNNATREEFFSNVLCRPPYIGMYQVELVPVAVTLARGKEVGVASQAGRLYKFVPSGH